MIRQRTSAPPARIAAAARAVAFFAVGACFSSLFDVVSLLGRSGFSAPDIGTTWPELQSRHPADDGTRRGEFGSQENRTDGEPMMPSSPAENHALGICSTLPHPAPTTLALWSSHLSDVFQSTQHPIDSGFVLHDFTAILLHLMTPERLQRSVKTLPHDLNGVGRVLDIFWKRLSYIRENGGRRSSSPRKLNILVMGGSVTMGVLCQTNPVPGVNMNAYSRRNCAWPDRLKCFLEKLLGGDVVTVSSITLGGSNTETGTTIWDYGLSDETPYPDILINAYSTNDMHVNSMTSASEQNKTLASNLFDVTQRFIRSVLQPPGGSKCEGRKPPLLIYFDDYVGNEQNEILQTTAVSETLNVLSTYYGIAHISYADAIRDMVYGDSAEEWFSPHGWFDKEGKFSRQIHPGTSMHISATWVIAFNLLNMITSYCSVTSGGSDIIDRNHGYQERADWEKRNYGYRPIRGLPMLTDSKHLAGGPMPKPSGLPPTLDATLKLETITQIWRGNSSYHDDSTDCDQHSNADNEPLTKPCAFAWVTGLSRSCKTKGCLNDKWKAFITENHGWAFEDDNSKLGFACNGPNSTFVFELQKLSQPVRSIAFLVMKSYGDKWSGSKISIDAFINRSPDTKEARVNSMEIEGFHAKQTSEIYVSKMDLTKELPEGALAGDSVKVAVELVGGSTFKITGLAFCDH